MLLEEMLSSLLKVILLQEIPWIAPSLEVFMSEGKIYQSITSYKREDRDWSKWLGRFLDLSIYMDMTSLVKSYIINILVWRFFDIGSRLEMFTRTLRCVQEEIQSQFVCGIHLVWSQSLPSFRLVTLPRWKNSVRPIIYQ